MIRSDVLSLAGVLINCVALFAAPPAQSASDSCVPQGVWVDLVKDTRIGLPEVIEGVAGRSVVLLGETHTSTEDHRWQLHVLAALHGRNPHFAIGLESFPRRIQPILDRWIAGALDEKSFLREVEWREVWGFDPALYLPIFHFARMHRVPMIALNVERTLISRVGQEGWDAIPERDREGVGDPVPATNAYLRVLTEVYARHRKDDDDHLPDEDDPKLRRFIEAQLAWDRAMAQAVVEFRSHNSEQIVGIIGRGHLEYGYGVPRQLAALGVEDASVLLTWSADRDCADLRSAEGIPVADAVFGVTPPDSIAPPPGPKLGVVLGGGDGNVRILSVVEGSVAATAGLAEGDVIRTAAGMLVTAPADLIAVVGRQAPGTWLPLTVDRNGEALQIVAKFPVRPHPPMTGPSPHRKKPRPRKPAPESRGG